MYSVPCTLYTLYSVLWSLHSIIYTLYSHGLLKYYLRSPWYSILSLFLSYTVKSFKSDKSVNTVYTLNCHSLLYSQTCQNSQNCLYSYVVTVSYAVKSFKSVKSVKTAYTLLALSLILSKVPKVLKLSILYTVTLSYTVKSIKSFKIAYTLYCHSLILSKVS